MDIQEINKLNDMLDSTDKEMVELGVTIARVRFKDMLSDTDEHSLNKQIKYVLSDCHNDGSVYGVNLWFKIKELLCKIAYIEGLKAAELWKLQTKSDSS